MEGEGRDVERYLGIQRPLLKNRVKGIRDYLLNSKDATFPTAVILAVDEQCAEFDEKTGVLYLHPYLPDDESMGEGIPYHKIAKVLDGQHRIAGFFEGEGDDRAFSYSKEFKVNVSIFVGIDLSEQAKIFATVNLAQTKVNKSLAYDLEDLAKKRSPFKTCHHIAVALDANLDGPFFQRIKRLGVATPGRDYEPLTQASFVEALVKFISDNPTRDRNDILDGKRLEKLDLQKYPFRDLFRKGEEGDVAMYEILFNYFQAVKKKWPNAWDAKERKGNLLPKSNAFKALMKYLKDDVYLDLVGDDVGAVPTVRQFAAKFKDVGLTDEDFTTRNFAPGSGGQSAFYKVLTGKIDPSALYEE
jgi:DGQHR domain-containing protein